MDLAPVAILVPVLRRPHRIRPLMESVAEATPEKHRLLFIASANDIMEISGLIAAGADFMTVVPRADGDYAFKINSGFRETDEPFVFTGADDLKFHPGWYPAAMAKMLPKIGVVGTNDLGNERTMKGNHSTHSLVRRSYIEKFGTADVPGAVYCELYPHEYVDDEMVHTARRRGRYAHAPDSHVEHLHPNWGKAESDELYEGQKDRMERGREIYARRSKLWR